MINNRYETIVVGAGIAGLTSAVYLAKAGQKVLLIEKNYECGGLVNSFSRDGFHFEAGVRALEDAGIILPMLKDLGIELDMVKSYVSVGIENEIVHIKDLSSLTEYKNLLIRLFPESKKEIEEMLTIIRKIMKHMDVLYGIENPAFKDLKRDKAFIFKKLLPWLPKFIFTIGKINRMNMPVETYLASVIKNQSLRDVISQHFFKYTPSFFALSYFSLYLDYFYPIGGVGKLADVLKDKFLEFDGEIKTETQIVQIQADKSIVIDQNNIDYKYNHLIWAADLKMLYKNTVTDRLSPEILSKFNDVKQKTLASRGGDSIFSLYLEIDEPLDSFRNIAHGHFFYTPSKIGLGEIHRADLNNILNNWDKYGKEEIFDWLEKFTALNTYEISIPGLKDSNLVPQGKTGLIISLLVEYDLFKKVNESGWLEEFKLKLEDLVLKVICESIYPMINNKVIKRFSFNPLSIESRIGSSEGAITGWTFEKPIPVVSKIQFSDRSVLTPIPSIYQAGQWAFSPAGVPMCILTGKLAADRVIKKWRK